MKTILIRLDAYESIGKGHLIRCLALSEELVRRDCCITFLSFLLDEASKLLILDSGHQYYLLSESLNDEESDSYNLARKIGTEYDAQQCIQFIQSKNLIRNQTAIIVDSYSIDVQWHRQLKSYCFSLCVIDDLSNRTYDCDVLVDQSYSKTKQSYTDLVPERTNLLIGSKFCLLRSEFLANRDVSLNRRSEARSQNNNSNNDKKPQQLLITMGGSDPNNYTLQMLDVVCSLEYTNELTITVVVGSMYQHLDTLQMKADASKNDQIRLMVDTREMAKLMAEADLCLTAAGSTLWEACVLGLPCIAIAAAENQKFNANCLARDGVILLADPSHAGNVLIGEQITHCYHDNEVLAELSHNAARICDGLGVKRVVDCLLNLSQS